MVVNLSFLLVVWLFSSNLFLLFMDKIREVEKENKEVL